MNEESVETRSPELDKVVRYPTGREDNAASASAVGQEDPPQQLVPAQPAIWSPPSPSDASDVEAATEPRWHESVTFRPLELLLPPRQRLRPTWALPLAPEALASVRRVSVRLATGELVPVALVPDETAVRERANALIRQIAERPGDWLLAEGRFLRPEAIVSIDVTPL